jgi:RNA polymerase sigma-70 factor (ECF subfamily)
MPRRRGKRDTRAFRITVEGPRLQLDESGLKDGTTAEVDDATVLFTRYSTGVYRYCLRRLRSPEEAEDALQVTYLNAWRSLKRGFEPEQPRPWLFQIAANVCATMLRSTLGGTRLELRDPSTLDELAGVEDAGSEELLGLSEALRELPSRQRRALVLRDWQGLSYNEIAAEMAVSDAAVETLLFRARNKVATALANPDWRRRLAPSRALLIWPFGFLRAKSMAAGGAEQLKIGLTLAGGTVVPLIAFGLIQGLLPGEPQQTTQETRPAGVSQLEGSPPSVSWLPEGLLLRASMPGARAGKTGVRPQAQPRKHAVSPQGVRAQSTAHPPSNAGPPGVAHESKLVLCHGTHSEERPAVTISVSKHALAGISQDSPGACGG